MQNQKLARFNKGSLFNIGYVESMKSGELFDCIFFADVDMMPEDSRTFFTCEFSPLHTTPYVNKWNYRYNILMVNNDT